MSAKELILDLFGHRELALFAWINKLREDFDQHKYLFNGTLSSTASEKLVRDALKEEKFITSEIVEMRIVYRKSWKKIAGYIRSSRNVALSDSQVRLVP